MVTLILLTFGAPPPLTLGAIPYFITTRVGALHLPVVIRSCTNSATSSMTGTSRKILMCKRCLTIQRRTLLPLRWLPPILQRRGQGAFPFANKCPDWQCAEVLRPWSVQCL